MAKKKTYYRKKQVLRAIGKYHRTTVSRVITLVGSNESLNLAGQAEAYDLSHMLTGTSPYQELGKQFALVKLRGIYIEVLPCQMTANNGMCCLALIQANEQNNVGVYGQPNVIPVSDKQITRKFFKLGNAWESTNALNAVSNIKLAFQIVQNFTGTKAWNILIKLYLTFKSNL